MGFQVRKRTKGKKGWLNFSGSGVSASIKLTPNITMNFGRRGTRTTVNFGGGIRYVTTNSKKKKVIPKKITPRVRDPRSLWEILCGKTIEEKNQELVKVSDAVKQIELTIENEKALNEIFIGDTEVKPIKIDPIFAKMDPLPEVKEIQEIVPSTFTIDPLIEQNKSKRKYSNLFFVGIKWSLICLFLYMVVGWLMTIKIVNV